MVIGEDSPSWPPTSFTDAKLKLGPLRSGVSNPLVLAVEPSPSLSPSRLISAHPYTYTHGHAHRHAHGHAQARTLSAREPDERHGIAYYQ